MQRRKILADGRVLCDEQYFWSRKYVLLTMTNQTQQMLFIKRMKAKLLKESATIPLFKKYLFAADMNFK
jgi:hypothetical protein